MLPSMGVTYISVLLSMIRYFATVCYTEHKLHKFYISEETVLQKTLMHPRRMSCELTKLLVEIIGCVLRTGEEANNSDVVFKHMLR